MSSCAHPAPFADLVLYWAGDLTSERSEELEEHLFSCADCTRSSARVAAITETIRGLVRPVVTQATVDSLRARGLQVEDNVLTPEQRSHVVFRNQDFIIHRLSGLSLESADRVHVAVRSEQSGEVLFELPAAPYDEERGEVLVACQRHFAVFPPEVVFTVTISYRDGGARFDEFFVSHQFSPL